MTYIELWVNKMSDDTPVILLEEPKIEGTAYSRLGNEGLVECIKAIPEGQVRASSRHISIARVLNPQNKALWEWYDVNNEGVRSTRTCGRI